MKHAKFFFGLFFLITLQIYSSSWFSQPVASIDINPFSASWLSISSNDGLTIINDSGTHRKKITNHLFITSLGHKVAVDNEPISSGSWHLLPHNGLLTINGKNYSGPATIHISPTRILVTAHQSDTAIADNVWPQPENKASSKKNQYIVRALIHELLPQENLTLTSEAGFILFDPLQPDKKRESATSLLTIIQKQNTLWINERAYNQEHLQIISKEGTIGINGSYFHGSLSLIKKPDRTLVINLVDLEEYVYSVLKTESWPGWPVEVNKVFAIASRTYAMAMMKQANIGKQPYHVKNTNAHQTYQGIHSSLTIRAAVEQTRGMFLIHNNEPALTMFDSCCGGIIPAHIDEFDFEKAPYLARTYPCLHCKRCWIYSWKKELSISDFSKQVEKLLHKPAFINDVKISKKDKAGLVQEIQIKHGKEQSYIHGKSFYKAMKEIKSFCYNVHRKKDTLIFSGRGFGHHLGICQWGAREMVRDGWPFKRILDFYYPGTRLMKLS